LVDEATRPFSQDARASRRIQFSAITTFRAQRSFEHTYALTDNMSRQGLYLRTLDPPPVGIYVQVNLRDKSGDIIEVRGTVAWRHAPNRVGGRVCPGFGLSIDERACAPDDLEKYRALYADALSNLEEIEKRQGNQLPGDAVPAMQTAVPAMQTAVPATQTAVPAKHAAAHVGETPSGVHQTWSTPAPDSSEVG